MFINFTQYGTMFNFHKLCNPKKFHFENQNLFLFLLYFILNSVSIEASGRTLYIG